jgi:AraC-like DNA-binding protein
MSTAAPAPGTGAIQVPALYLRTLMELTLEMGYEPKTWLQAAGIGQPQLTQATVELSTEQYVALVRAAVLYTHEPALGLLLGQRLRMNTHGTLAFALMNSASLRQAIALLERFLPVRTNLLTLCFADHATQPQLQFAPAADLDVAELLILETVMLAVRNVFDYLAPGAQAVQAVEFCAAVTPYTSLAQDLFACPVHYGANYNALHLNPHALDMPLSTADAHALENAAAMCQAELDKITRQESLTARIQRSLLGTAGAMPSLQTSARMLHMAPRTLHRRLEAEGTSYRAIVDLVRHRLARQHLKNSNISLQEIAYRLGYTDQANFRRAFKRWGGVAPQSMRTQKKR